MAKNITATIKQFFSIKNLLLILLLFALAGGTFETLNYLWKEKEQSVRTDLKEYQKTVLENESELLSAQLVNYVVRGKELARARIFRLAMDGLKSAKKKEVRKAQEDFNNFVKVSGYSAGCLFEPDGNIFASTDVPEEIVGRGYKEAVLNTLHSRTPLFLPLRTKGNDLVADLFIPVYDAYATSTATPPSRVLMLEVPMTAMLRTFLGSERTFKYESSIHLIQKNGKASEEATFNYPNILKLQTMKVSFEGVNEVLFGERANLSQDKKVYSSARFIPVVNWWVMIETATAVPNRIISIYQQESIIFASLLLAAMIFFVLTVRFIASTRKYHRKSSRLEEKIPTLQKELSLLRIINNSLPEPVTLKKSEDGAFIHVNKSFTDFTGLKQTEALNLTDNQVFDHHEAETLSHGDQMVTMSNSPYSEELVMTRGSSKSTIQVTFVPCTVDEENDAILTVYRDVTSEKSVSERGIEVRQQVINALIRAVESVPFLDGHTSLMRKLALEIAETLLLSDADCATVEAAAILSQVGKTFVPREIMEKEGKLTPEEIKETQRYIEHTCKILEGVEFDLPITQTIWQMQENLDGSGYPNKLEGRSISTLARILGVTNTFSALVQKRSYRKANTARQAVDILQSMADVKYDSTVIEALGAVIETKSGKAILQESQVEI
ncbi:HD domain-containing phosphohydrolase [Maridesulfovibrio salexigens]|uniref:Putative PAS/PAC sensor protein n=1 Tax=Maridesulfovibrio salexigens (strain ATCC 14822 / DSM 2638 / NCIMB 8403 / VKM B-1763) TaxID=526222 RepID=C6BWJ1_MARSD|nr:HD domain-containing phosphohydrolase [Maridesulfovibrio salexigens]ACS80271.1 putative PAS/PAC sensor protein [Maridesulfovibrio salexigens DSM 2638]